MVIGENQMTVEQMQELMRRATELHENSWQAGTGDELRVVEGQHAGYGHYKISTDEAVLTVCRDMKLDERFVLPISILINTGYCEIDDWMHNP